MMSRKAKNDETESLSNGAGPLGPMRPRQDSNLLEAKRRAPGSGGRCFISALVSTKAQVRGSRIYYKVKPSRLSFLNEPACSRKDRPLVPTHSAECRFVEQSSIDQSESSRQTPVLWRQGRKVSSFGSGNVVASRWLGLPPDNWSQLFW